ncbi:hypothetical protein [Mycobacterium ostraviense]|uniref:Uncharacterized protein n=1 Tax=Mycobacterium ostraviense TaxID=2738409 RepID=A0A164B4K1_9MYCO|nr:hypothetical protein [Mycobacterium ostraviense]KZS63112.1 hypothetical protein A4G28_04575 [Mycobacterium ostraviense]
MQNIITYRKTKQGQWVVYGPARCFGQVPASGRWIEVTKRDGTIKRELIDHLGKCFQVDGEPMVYGYIRPQAQMTRSQRFASYQDRLDAEHTRRMALWGIDE